jgi:hypothetical protein
VDDFSFIYFLNKWTFIPIVDDFCGYRTVMVGKQPFRMLGIEFEPCYRTLLKKDCFPYLSALGTSASSSLPPIRRLI